MKSVFSCDFLLVVFAKAFLFTSVILKSSSHGATFIKSSIGIVAHGGHVLRAMSFGVVRPERVTISPSLWAGSFFGLNLLFHFMRCFSLFYLAVSFF